MQDSTTLAERPSETQDMVAPLDWGTQAGSRNLHREVHEKGFKVLPILPVEGRFAPGVPEAAKGKAPGRLTDGYWLLRTNWNTQVASDRDLEEWHAQGAGVGVRPDDDVMFIDNDCHPEDAEAAEVIDGCVREVFGDGIPCRHGNGQRRTYALRLQVPRKSEDIPFEGGNIELRTGAGQVVCYGIHPKTRKPFWWSTPLCAKSDVPLATEDSIAAFKALLVERLPGAEPSRPPTGAAAIDLGQLKADPSRLGVVVEAVDSLANGEGVPRKVWIRRAHAIKAAFADAPGTGLECWERHSELYPDNDPDDTERTWNTIRLENVRIGVWHLLRSADGGKFGQFSIRYVYEEVEQPAAADHTEPYAHPPRWMDFVAELEGYRPTPRQFTVEGWVPDNEVTLLYGDGGMGKTLLAQMLGTCVSIGAPWLGQRTKQCKVMAVFCEDAEDELLARQRDIIAPMGVTHRDLGNFRISSRRHQDNVLALWDRSTGAMKLQPAWFQLRDDAVAFGAKLLIMDTIADFFAGNEIDRAQVTSFVKSCLGRLAHEIGGAVVALGHPSMSGRASGTGTSGSTAWSNAVRSRLYLRYPKGVDKGNIRELEGMKLNYGPKGNLLKLRWNKGTFEVVAATIQGAPSSQPRLSSLPHLSSVEDSCDAAVIDALNENAGAVLSLKVNSQNYAPRALRARSTDLLAAYGLEEVRSSIERLMAKGVVVELEVGRDAGRRPQMGFSVLMDKLSALPAAGSPFE